LTTGNFALQLKSYRPSTRVAPAEGQAISLQTSPGTRG
jgi:hypothetical protein